MHGEGEGVGGIGVSFGMEGGAADGSDDLSGGRGSQESGSGVESIDGEDSEGDYEIRFFRFKNRLFFDSSDDEEMEDLQQEEIDYLTGVPENWESRDVKKCIYCLLYTSDAADE